MRTKIIVAALALTALVSVGLYVFFKPASRPTVEAVAESFGNYLNSTLPAPYLTAISCDRVEITEEGVVSNPDSNQYFCITLMESETEKACVAWMFETNTEGKLDENSIVYQTTQLGFCSHLLE
ncbi:MAG: hypothetical protein QXU32_02245 [Nitrososphaerales archaeon]